MQENKIEYRLIAFDDIPEGQPGGCRFCGRSWIGPGEVVGIESELNSDEVFDILYKIMPGAAKHREEDKEYIKSRSEVE